MAALEEIERRGLFRLTRFLAFTVIGVLSLGIVVAAVEFTNDFMPPQVNHRISYAKIQNELNPSATYTASPDESSTAKPTLTQGDIPPLLRPYFDTPRALAFLSDEVSGLTSEERSAYLINMSEVVAGARSDKAEVIPVIGQYMKDKRDQAAAERASQATRTQRQIYIAGGVISTLFLIALASLILVLLAIERNTRQSKVEEEMLSA